MALATGQFQLHPQGSYGSNGQRCRKVVNLHDKSRHSRARIPTLEQEPEKGRLDLKNPPVEPENRVQSYHPLKMAVSGDGASGSNPHFIRRRHVVLVDYVTIFLQSQEWTPF